MLQAIRVCRLREVDWQTKHVQLAAVVAERLQKGTALLEQHSMWCEQRCLCETHQTQLHGMRGRGNNLQKQGETLCTKLSKSSDQLLQAG